MKLSKYISLAILLLFIGFTLFTACKKEDENNPSSKEEQDQILQDYFTKNNITAQKTASGLYHVITEQGTPIQNGETIKVNYEGKLLSGKKFDSSFDRGTPFSFPVRTGQVIRGWDEGIPIIGKGGKGVLYIPSHLGYGARGSGSIAPYAILVFRVEVFN
jgi:FKBP-type peptidyl-prolyl cis-trans isomerase